MPWLWSCTVASQVCNNLLPLPLLRLLVRKQEQASPSHLWQMDQSCGNLAKEKKITQTADLQHSLQVQMKIPVDSQQPFPKHADREAKASLVSEKLLPGKSIQNFSFKEKQYESTIF